MSNEDVPENASMGGGPLESLTRNAAADLRESGPLWEAYEADAAQFVTDLGESVPSKRLDTSADTLRLLRSGRQQRIAAALFISSQHPPERQVLRALVQVALTDQDSVVRGMALRAWFRISENCPEAAEEMLTAVVRSECLRGRLAENPGIVQMIARAFAASVDQHVCDERGLRHKRESSARLLKELAGDRLPQMEASLSDAIQFLNHSNPKLRRAAINLIRDRWAPTKEFLDSCERIVEFDSDFEVRDAAMYVLSRHWKGTRKQSICRKLAAILRDPANPMLLRQHAYISLHEVSGEPGVGALMSHMLNSGFDLEHDVRWDFVDSFA